jgi:DNA-binding IclR family transcriptional regulator
VGVTIRCPHCSGAGRIELTGLYLVTFMALAEAGEETTGAKLARRLGAKPTAVNNRLVALERHGLATSRRWGRERLFLAKTLRHAKAAGATP